MKAKKLEDKAIILGQLILVENQLKEKNQNDKYISLQVEDESGAGDTERCLLFTENEINNIETIDLPFASDKMVKGRIYTAKINKQDTNLIKVILNKDTEKILRVSNSQLASAEERMKRNPEDLTVKSFWVDLND